MTDLTLVIGNKNYSSWSLRPWVLLKQFALEFDEVRVPLFTESTASALAKYNSDFKVPVLIHGDIMVWDTLAILEYISETLLDDRGWPVQAKARAFARSISCEMHSSFANVRNELPMNCRKKFADINLSAAAEAEIARIKSLWNQSRSEFGQAGEWLFGNYSIADAMFAPIALRFSGYSIALNDVEEAYVQSVLSQSCIKEWIDAGCAETEVIAEDEINLRPY
ncbi:MAG: glutathione S-transferase family protein [Gammaproteobacteria bacterium]|nr:glutathione S-transferase family protein [Gammaproteobacteria bacterium]